MFDECFFYHYLVLTNFDATHKIDSTYLDYPNISFMNQEKPLTNLIFLFKKRLESSDLLYAKNVNHARNFSSDCFSISLHMFTPHKTSKTKCKFNAAWLDRSFQNVILKRNQRYREWQNDKNDLHKKSMAEG